MQYFKKIIISVCLLFVINSNAVITYALPVNNSEILMVTDYVFKANDLINKMESLDSSKYTSETWAVLEAELANAKNVLNNEEATSEEVDNAEKALRTAFDGLLANATDDNNGSGNSGSNGNNGNNGNGGNSGNGNKPSEKPQKPGNNSGLPQTGGTSSVLAVVFGGILAAGGALLGRKNKKK